jgi:hypothetical protein
MKSTADTGRNSLTVSPPIDSDDPFFPYTVAIARASSSNPEMHPPSREPEFGGSTQQCFQISLPTATDANRFREAVRLW